jgi:enoyl-ACP reductase-like protein
VLNSGLEQRMAADPTLRDKFLSGIPAGRLGRPEDIRGLAVFLASDASSWISGALIPMDGGNLAANAGATIRPGSKDEGRVPSPGGEGQGQARSMPHRPAST